MRGFTLIELVVVIVLLGILSAIALPRFVDLRGDAKRAKNKYVHGAFKTAVLNAQAKWQTMSGEEAILSLKGTVPDTLFSAEGLILSATKDTILTTSSTRLPLDSSSGAVTDEYHEICANIFRNIMSDSSSMSVITQNSSTLLTCNTGAIGNPLGGNADICAVFLRSPSTGSACQYHLDYNAMTINKRTSIIYYFTSSTDPIWSLYPPGAIVLYTVAPGKPDLREL